LSILWAWFFTCRSPSTAGCHCSRHFPHQPDQKNPVSSSGYLVQFLLCWN